MTVYRCTKCQFEVEIEDINPLDPGFDEAEEHEMLNQGHEVRGD